MRRYERNRPESPVSARIGVRRDREMHKAAVVRVTMRAPAQEGVTGVRAIDVAMATCVPIPMGATGPLRVARAI